MVRINLLNPRSLADQHLIAEYNEILKFFGHMRKYPHVTSAPCRYCLGKGHIVFFKDKLLYLKKRHELLKKEMRRRGFRPNKNIKLGGFSKKLVNDWRPKKADKDIIKKRLVKKINEKPHYYKYCREKKKPKFFIDLIKKSL
jgi:deoxyribonuclease (pyrimidine dimer)